CRQPLPLEHMSDTIMFLEKIRNLINTNGVLICEVPNVREMLLDNCKEYDDFYWIRAHLNYFSRETLLECFKKAEYSDVDIKFEQRYGLINLCNWLTTGKPQIGRPIFEISDAYKPIESFYRQYLESIGRSDAIIAIARV
ncbi:MAG: class I SAM-dependent methyltransferase, partial [Actinobacteria bacterium]|nr:class I SAM-dependent methyltransferase [Actinomycetota bacterium]